MIRWAIPLALLAGCSQPVRTGGPMGGPVGGPMGGIVSTNPCADAILLRLVPPQRIAAISHYSLDPGATSIPLEQARRFRTTAGTAEEVIAMAPDLVVTSSFTPLATRTAYRRAGLHVLTLDSPATVAGSKAQVAEIAAAVGAVQRGRRVIGEIAQAVATASPGPGGVRPSALLFIGGDLVNGGGTLLDELMRIAGWRNAAADYGLRHTGTLPVETLAANPPTLILTPDAASRSALLRRRVLGGRSREARFARSLVNCGGPTIVPALARLAALRRIVS